MRALIFAAALLLSGCADQEARDQASAAEEEAMRANARTDEAEQKLDDLEDRVQSLEYASDP